MLLASVMNISLNIVRYLDTDYVHSPTGSFNSPRAYTLPADAYELPVSSGQSIGGHVVSRRVASRRVSSRLVAGIMDTATQSITQSPAAPHIINLSRSTGCLTTNITLTPWHNVFLISCESLNSFINSVSTWHTKAHHGFHSSQLKSNFYLINLSNMNLNVIHARIK
jgi:hypothetical protein